LQLFLLPGCRLLHPVSEIAAYLGDNNRHSKYGVTYCLVQMKLIF
jgi:hypothetical protein